MAKKTLFFDAHCGYEIAAVVENGKIAEFYFEQPDKATLVGNIYKGKVESVLPGMQAAFVNCGLERNCYLSVADILPDAGKYDGESGGAPAFPELKEGNEIMVQVVKPPINKKGARVTCFPNFVGKYLIYMPLTPFVGVSRKITDAELRKNLIYSADRLKDGDEGLVFRTAAPYAKRDRLEFELNYLKNLYSEVTRTFNEANVGDLLYTDLNLLMRVMRDTLNYDLEKIIVGNSKMEKLFSDLMNLYPAQNRCPVVLHKGDRDMLEEYNLTQQINNIVSPRVPLDNGADLVIEKTEALTVIDVNTGKFIGDENLEQTVYHTNVLAAREIARQVKLRNIGGIVVVDFIDMLNETHKNAVVDELKRALKKDSAKCSVAPMSEFGLIEFTRKRTGVNTHSLLTKPCRHCKTGYVKSPRFVILGIRVKLMNMYSEGHRSMRVDLNYDVLNEITGWQELLNDLKTRLDGAEVYAVPHKTYHDEQINYRTETENLPEKAVKLI